MSQYISVKLLLVPQHLASVSPVLPNFWLLLNCRFSGPHEEKMSQIGSLHIIQSVNVFRKLQK